MRVTQRESKEDSTETEKLDLGREEEKELEGRGEEGGETKKSTNVSTEPFQHIR
jgi:hypothetical protein